MKLGCTTPRFAVAGLLTLLTVAAASIALVRPAGAQPAPSAAPSASAGANGGAMPGKQVFQEVCGNCHDLTVSTDQTKSRDEWQATVSRMANSGAPLSDEQVTQVVDYLAKTYGTK